MLSRQTSNHDSTFSASDSSTIEHDSQQGVGRILFNAMRLAGTVVERRLAASQSDTTGSTSSATLESSSEWDDLSESSTISNDTDQGVGRIVWQLMRFAGEQTELLTMPDDLGKQARAR